MNEHKSDTVSIEQDGEDFFLTFPEEMLEQLNWQEGDVLKWIDNGDGSWSLTKMQYDSDSGLTENLE